jgi:hypothetical protein
VPARKLGVAPGRITGEADELAVLGYAATPQQVASMLAAYRGEIGQAPLAVALRPLLPDCATSANLAAKVAVARDVGARRVDFYHYAMAPLDRLDWIAAALTAST